MDFSEEASDQISAEAAAIATIAGECIVEKAPVETWRRRVLAVFGTIGTRLPILRNGRRPKFFADADVRERLIALHREVTIEDAVTDCQIRFGRDRAPSQSAVARFWLYLDKLQKRTGA